LTTILSFVKFLNSCGESDQLIVHLNFAKNGWAKRSKKRKAKLRVKIFQILIFDAKLRFAFFASLRSAIFSEIEVDNKLVLFPAGVNPFCESDLFPQFLSLQDTVKKNFTFQKPRARDKFLKYRKKIYSYKTAKTWLTTVISTVFKW